MQQANEYSSNSRQRIIFDKVSLCAAVPSKMLKIVKCLPKVLLAIYVMGLCLLPCFCVLLKRRFESVTKILMS